MLRKEATYDFQKDLSEPINNGVFGKTMENLCKWVDTKPVCAAKEDQLRRLRASSDFARANIFDDDLAATQVHKSRLTLNRPVYVDNNVLHLSEHLKYALMKGYLMKYAVTKAQ